MVEAKTFTAAAKNLGIPKSTVSRQVAQLESRLGVRLLQRTTRSVRPTELGALYYERCGRIVSEAEDAERILSRYQEQPRGLLRLTVPVDLGISIMPKIIDQYLRSHLEVSIELDVSDRYVDLVTEGYDMAIRAGQLEDSTLIAHRLYQDQMRILASPVYIERYGKPLVPEDLKKHEFIVFSSMSPRLPLRFTGSEGDTMVDLNSRISINNLNTIKGVCLQGSAIGMLPGALAREVLDAGLLISLLDDWVLQQAGVYVIYPSPRHLTPKVRSFIDFLDHYFQPKASG
ncbi:MAG: LysR family transcriptional regulator [Gammaproteobacteria bacterium]|nr:LysR family transcriptional regulator [Gammaproteobacteria bacterium]